MKRLYDLLCDARKILDELDIPYGHIQLVEMKNSSRVWGRCTQIGNNTYKIEIHKCLLVDNVTYEAAMNTVIHELLHAYKK